MQHGILVFVIVARLEFGCRWSGHVKGSAVDVHDLAHAMQIDRLKRLPSSSAI